MTTKETCTGLCNRHLHNGFRDSVLGTRRGWLRLSAGWGMHFGGHRTVSPGPLRFGQKTGSPGWEALYKPALARLPGVADHASLSLCPREGVDIFRFLFLCFARCPVFSQLTVKVKHVDAASGVRASGPIPAAAPASSITWGMFFDLPWFPLVKQGCRED